MKKITIHKNKSETFRCQFKAEGVEATDIVVRLCLEFDNNKNMFFYGEVNENGDCSINIPILNEMKSKGGKLTIEAIADSMYFKLYEAEVEIKSSVEIKMETTLTKDESPKSKIQLETIFKDGPKKVEAKVEQVAEPEETFEPEETTFEQVVPEPTENPYIVRNSTIRSGLKSFSSWKRN